MGNKIIAVVGPTGSGKTALAVKLAKKFNGVLISADSRQVYIGLDVGTNKEGLPGEWCSYPARLISNVPQLMIDVVQPGTRFTLADWLDQVRQLLIVIWKQGKLPIIVGGTGLYVSALTEGYILGNGRYSNERQPVNFESLILEIGLERKELLAKSDQRYERIFDQLCQEVSLLLTQKVSPEWLERIGLDYRFTTLAISGQTNRETALSGLKKASRAYIRRQETWWRHHGSPIKVASPNEAEQLVEKFLNN